MKNISTKITTFMTLCLLMACEPDQEQETPIIRFDFEEEVKSNGYELSGQDYTFAKGIDNKALVLEPEKGFNTLELESENINLDGTMDFSVQCWVKTISKKPTVFLSKKDFKNKGILAQKNAGWSLYSSDGTFGWSIGSGERRINYERDNGERMPINDGNWHQLTITYNKALSEFRLYYDGHNKAIYKVNFDFSNNNPLTIGSKDNQFDYDGEYSPQIESGLKQLQLLVDEFNSLGLEDLKEGELLELIANTDKLFEKKLKGYKGKNRLDKSALSKVLDIKKELMPNPYTVFQNMKLTPLKPVNKIYSLKDGKVIINEKAGRSFTKSEQLYAADFTMDRLSIWDKTISEMEVMKSYNKFKKTKPLEQAKSLKTLTVGAWNIWHGGIHWTLEKDGWDSRMRIVEMIKEKDLDIILMQETYSSGDFIAAELGYYYATTSDWDYCYQGENISVISRYPIKEVRVSEKTEFNNVAAKLAISDTQELWAMSNWYGMGNFQEVFDFHKNILQNTDSIPVVFGGDFNSVPHTDNGNTDNLASIKFEQEGFTDAYRSLYPDIEKYPGYTHKSGRRIDQLYYKGKLKNKSTEVITEWPGGFPSDHHLIVTKFELNY